jgi:hypothetical protein
MDTQNEQTPWDVTQPQVKTVAQDPWVGEEPIRTQEYYPLIETLRLYAGWLLAWYIVVYALGSYLSLNEVPWTPMILSDLVESPVLQLFTLGAFLFLLGTTIHRMLGRGVLKGIILTIIFVGMLGVYAVNM